MSASLAFLRTAARSTRSAPALFRSPYSAAARAYSTVKESAPPAEQVEGTPVDASAELLEQKDKLIAELKDSRLRSLADFENLQKITTREKIQAKDFALTSFARDLISSIDILSLALKSITPDKLASNGDVKPNKDLVELHQGVSMTKKEIEKVLKRHGVVAFDPTGEQFDPNKHEALYQAPVPGKTAGEVLECQEIGYMIKERLLRPAKVGVVLGASE